MSAHDKTFVLSKFLDISGGDLSATVTIEVLWSWETKWVDGYMQYSKESDEFHFFLQYPYSKSHFRYGYTAHYNGRVSVEDGKSLWRFKSDE